MSAETRATNPNSPRLMDLSTARPSDVDMDIFSKKLGNNAPAKGQQATGTVNPNYLKECREEDPWPAESSCAPKSVLPAKTATVTLSDCRIDTPPEDLATDQPFEMSVKANGEGAANSAIEFRLFCSILSGDDKETFEDQSAVWTSRALNGEAKTVGSLLSPHGRKLAHGTKLKYYITANPQNSSENAESPKVEVVYGKPPKPLAIWSLGPGHFGFDSSFILPSVANEILTLKKLLEKHPDSGFSIFGHSESSDTNELGPSLSGRRAYALYCLLTRNVDGWIELSKGIDGDEWRCHVDQVILGQLKNSSGQPIYNGMIDRAENADMTPFIKAYQEITELKVDGVIDARTKKSLYTAYMDQICTAQLKQGDFLGNPYDKSLQWACSDCRNFNPLLVLSIADEEKIKSPEYDGEFDLRIDENPRVSVFMFPSTLKGNRVATLPCPPWSSRSDSCQKQLLSNTTNDCRIPTEKERTWRDSKNTFACQFYAMMAKNESSPPIPAPGRIIDSWYEDHSGAKLSSLRIGDIVYLTVLTENLIGGKININLTEIDANFAFNTTLVEGNILKKITVTSNTMKIILTVKSTQKSHA